MPQCPTYISMYFNESNFSWRMCTTKFSIKVKKTLWRCVMKKNFLIILSILALSCHLPSFSCLLSYSMSTFFEGSWSSPHWFVLFIHDRRSFRGHSHLTLFLGARAWGPNFSLLWGNLSSPASVGFLLRDWGFLIRVFFLVETRSLVS